MADRLVYLYAVCQASGQAGGHADGHAGEQLAGVAEAPVRLIRHGDLAAAVSEVSEEEFGEQALRRNLEDLDWVEHLVRAHDSVTRQVAASTATAPARAATVFRGEERVREILDGHQATLRELLRQLAGCSEWGVKVQAVPAPVPARDEETGGAGGAGTAYLLRRKAQQDRRLQAGQQLATQVREIDTRLTEHAVAARHHPPQDPRLSGQPGTMVLNAAYLVAAENEPRFTTTADELGSALSGARLSVTGPWPAYSFATLPGLS